MEEEKNKALKEWTEAVLNTAAKTRSLKAAFGHDIDTAALITVLAANGKVETSDVSAHAKLAGVSKKS